MFIRPSVGNLERASAGTDYAPTHARRLGRTWVLPMKHCERATALPDRGSGRGSRGIRIERKQFLGVRYAAQSVSSHRNEPTFNVADIGKRR